MRLSDLAKATALVKPNHSILVYGPPKSGKTRLIGTAAQIPEIERIFWFDTENGAETLLNMGLDEQALAKIILFKLPDTRENPVAIETMLKAFSAKQPIAICDEHGVVNCIHCKQGATFQGELFRLADCTHNDLVVVDSGSQLGDSAVNATCKGKPADYKPGWDEYGLSGKWLGDILTIMQQAHHTNFVVATHEIALEGDDGKDRMYPLIGSKNFSMKVAKYFGTVVYAHMKMNKHAAGSSSTYRSDVLTGSRVNAKIESSELSMRTILVDGGILKSTDSSAVEQVAKPAVAASNSATAGAARALASLRKG